ncbi:MAG TPA: alpha/beta fold hydrolase [Polyangia bacterium]|nr:alpha/beta fold hydrolase [Polyangia bacterium]
MKTFALAFVGLALSACMPPSWGANALLHPTRHVSTREPDRPFDAVEWAGEGVKLEGWWFHTTSPRRATLVYLHGVSDNRGSSVGIADHFVPVGFDVVSYDSRAHGESTGDACTYGYWEKVDLARVLDRLPPGPVVVMGTSLGGAVALQAAAKDARISAVVAVAPFSDLRTVASERAPFFASRGNLDDAFRLAEAEAHFRVDEVSPVAAAPHIRVPVLLVHGDADQETPYAHSKRIFAALGGPKRLITIAGGGHRGGFTPATWREVDAWIDGALAHPAPPASSRSGGR